jgi:hypothetical protein
MRLAAIVLASLLPLALAASASAATPADVKEADALFTAGQKLLNEGKTHEACAKFARSQELDAGLGTLLNLARCHAKEGLAVTARREFTDAAVQASARGPEERDRAEYARKQAADLDGKIATVKLDLPAGATSVEVDGRALAQGAWEQPIPLDPGDHRVVVVGPGKAPRQGSITVPPGPGALSLAVPLAASDHDPGGEDPRSSDAGGADPHHGRRLAGFVVGGVGVAGVVVGAVFGARAIGKKSDEKSHCQGAFCDPAGLALDEQAHGAATISTVAVGVGLAAIGVGTVLVLISRAPKKPAAAYVHVMPTAGLGSGGLDVRGTF